MGIYTPFIIDALMAARGQGITQYGISKWIEKNRQAVHKLSLTRALTEGVDVGALTVTDARYKMSTIAKDSLKAAAAKQAARAEKAKTAAAASKAAAKKKARAAAKKEKEKEKEKDQKGKTAGGKSKSKAKKPSPTKSPKKSTPKK
jgi:hypothetical protein